MNNQALWRPSRILKDSSGRFCFNTKEIYAGSWHMAEIQVRNYVPLIEQYAMGKLLDCGCGQLPWYSAYEKSTHFVYAIDWSENPLVSTYLDEVIDLNKSFRLKETGFDTILLTDVIAHIAHPDILIESICGHLRKEGHLILTTPFVYWISEYPHEYFHMTETALRQLCDKHHLEIIHLESYGGYGDVFLDTLNKGMTSRLSHRIFRMLASVVKKTSWYKKVNLKTRYSYPLGYTLVAKKK